MSENDAPRPPSRLRLHHDDGTVSAWTKDRTYGTTKVLDHATVFVCAGPQPGDQEADAATGDDHAR